MKSKLIGRKAYIIDSDSIYCGEWGIIDDYDGDVYYIRIADDKKSAAPIFDRNQFRVPRERSDK